MAEFRSANMFGSGGSTNGCVLVVADELSVREELRATLERTGYDVMDVENGEKAIEAIGSGENPLVIDVIITDIDNPRGLDAIAYFKKQHPRISLIVLTGLSEVEAWASESTKIVIIGGGKGGTALLGLFRHLPGVEIVGIADKDPSAPALQRARELGISVSTDPVSLIVREDNNLIVDVTGAPEMERLIAEQKPSGTEVLGGGQPQNSSGTS